MTCPRDLQFYLQINEFSPSVVIEIINNNIPGGAGIYLNIYNYILLIYGKIQSQQPSFI